MFLSALSLAAAVGMAQEARPQVMVLGSFHFAQPNLDLMNPSVPDIDGARRQREIQAIVDSVAKWKPTKVCLEVPYGNTSFPELYKKYAAGEHELSKSESQQIGFRVAKQLGHETVYCIDFRSDMDFNGVMQYAAEHGQMDKINALLAEAQAELNKIFAPEASEKLTIAEILAWMNQPSSDEFSHQMYMEMAKVGGGENYPGADMVAGWQTRNLKIAVNTTRVIDKPDDRILIVIGMGHAKLLRDYFRQMRDIEEVSPLPYLEGLN